MRKYQVIYGKELGVDYKTCYYTVQTPAEIWPLLAAEYGIAPNVRVQQHNIKYDDDNVSSVNRVLMAGGFGQYVYELIDAKGEKIIEFYYLAVDSNNDYIYYY